MFEQTLSNIDDVLRKEAGCTTELDDIEQTSWILFLKYLDDFEHDRAVHADLLGKRYAYFAGTPTAGPPGPPPKNPTAPSTTTPPSPATT